MAQLRRLKGEDDVLTGHTRFDQGVSDPFLSPVFLHPNLAGLQPNVKNGVANTPLIGPAHAEKQVLVVLSSKTHGVSTPAAGELLNSAASSVRCLLISSR
jgi:hypothetical protein